MKAFRLRLRIGVRHAQLGERRLSKTNWPSVGGVRPSPISRTPSRQIGEHNKAAKSFVWTMPADAILAKINPVPSRSP
jgi:hypothetical protein